MSAIEKCVVPADTFLHKYTRDGSYADCYLSEVPEPIAFPEYIFAFYTTRLFRLERFVLTVVVSKPSTDTQAQQLADGVIERFAAWNVEARSEREILMCDFLGRTRSWLMVIPMNTVNGVGTQLYFGSAVVPQRNSKTASQSLGFGFRALLGFHRIYSRLLLRSAKSQIVLQLSRRL